VVRAACDGEDVNALLEHYRTRLLAGFKRHLEACREFYADGRSGPWWDQELGRIDCGLDWCARQLDGSAGSRYRLAGFSLQRVQ
jgi:hypothetical protein